MKTVLAFAALFAGVATMVHAEGNGVSPAACERLASSLALPNTRVATAVPVAAGSFTPPDGGRPVVNLPAFCRVALALAPTSDSDIRSEVWLPMSGWNGKLYMVGNGAWGGSIQYAAMAEGLRRGYAAVSTDTGHTGADASFAVGHPEKLIDFGYRSVHETAVQSKATAAALYGTAPRLSYFNGCSGGGRQAFMEAQRYPGDFDGIIAGAPGYNRTDGAFQVLGAMQATHLSPESFIPEEKYAVLHRAALAACDAKDGLKDGLITEPMSCRFDPAVTACTAGDAPTCLTAPQVAAAKRIYAPVLHPRTGALIFAGIEPGSEPFWGAVAGKAPHPMYYDLARFIVFQDANWDVKTLDLAEHLDRARRADNGVLSALSTDIRPFIDRGGKLLMYHGWADQNIAPRMTVQYVDEARTTMGAAKVDEGMRLFLVPGMGHCGGGEAPNTFDTITALEQWREHGKAPRTLLASQIKDGQVVRSRPICAYPQVARYDGRGDVTRAESFTCVTP